jgi:hypothetical protein
MGVTRGERIGWTDMLVPGDIIRGILDSIDTMGSGGQ